MAVPDSHSKADLHEAYLLAVAAQAGYSCEFIRRDYGVDARIAEVALVRGKYQDVGLDFRVQLKATSSFRRTPASVRCELEADAHNRLVDHEYSLVVLVLFCMPSLPGDRLEITEDCLKLQHCCYWYPRPTILTTNARSVTIDIPRTQLFTPEVCQHLMQQARERQR